MASAMSLRRDAPSLALALLRGLRRRSTGCGTGQLLVAAGHAVASESAPRWVRRVCLTGGTARRGGAAWGAAKRP